MSNFSALADDYVERVCERLKKEIERTAQHYAGKMGVIRLDHAREAAQVVFESCCKDIYTD